MGSKAGTNEVAFDLDASAFSNDDFRMFQFKMKRCPRARPHDWTQCPFAHPGEKAKRRDPRRFQYSGSACPEFRRNGCCRRGDACPFAHGVFECWLHPSRYRTQMCTDGTSCKRRVCFFAHTESELRKPEEDPLWLQQQVQAELASEQQAQQQMQTLKMLNLMSGQAAGSSSSHAAAASQPEMSIPGGYGSLASLLGLNAPMQQQPQQPAFSDEQLKLLAQHLSTSMPQSMGQQNALQQLLLQQQQQQLQHQESLQALLPHLQQVQPPTGGPSALDILGRISASGQQQQQQQQQQQRQSPNLPPQQNLAAILQQLGLYQSLASQAQDHISPGVPDNSVPGSHAMPQKPPAMRGSSSGASSVPLDLSQALGSQQAAASTMSLLLQQSGLLGGGSAPLGAHPPAEPQGQPEQASLHPHPGQGSPSGMAAPPVSVTSSGEVKQSIASAEERRQQQESPTAPEVPDPPPPLPRKPTADDHSATAAEASSMRDMLPSAPSPALLQHLSAQQQQVAAVATMLGQSQQQQQQQMLKQQPAMQQQVAAIAAMLGCQQPPPQQQDQQPIQAPMHQQAAAIAAMLGPQQQQQQVLPNQALQQVTSALTGLQLSSNDGKAMASLLTSMASKPGMLASARQLLEGLQLLQAAGSREGAPGGSSGVVEAETGAGSSRADFPGTDPGAQASGNAAAMAAAATAVSASGIPRNESFDKILSELPRSLSDIVEMANLASEGLGSYTAPLQQQQQQQQQPNPPSS